MKKYDSIYDVDGKMMEYLQMPGKDILQENSVLLDSIFLDIETTGLKKETSLIYLVSCGYFNQEKLVIHQWFNDDAVSEEEILLTLISFLEKHPGPVITFNGENFDLPFLKAHFEYNELSNDIFSRMTSFDLYKILRGFAPLYQLENGSQKSWERFLGIFREDTYDGGKLIPVYKKYLDTKNPDLLHKILLHNLEDVKGLASLIPLLSLLQLQGTSFQMNALEESVWHDNPAIKAQLTYDKVFPKELLLESSHGSVRITGENILYLTIPYKEGKMYHFYPDYQNYYYLPLEDRAIHKKIGCYVDKEHRKKASAKNCYYPLKSIFFPVPKKSFGYGFTVDVEGQLDYPLFRATYESKDMFLSYDHLFENDCVTEYTKRYLCNMIQAVLLTGIRGEIRGER